MHDTAYEHGRLFFDLYWISSFTTVIELGSQDVNGTLRDHCPSGASYVGIDATAGRGVDLVVAPGSPLPFAGDSLDVAVTSSAFEHDICFWETFLEIMRVLREGGLLYVNAPSNYAFHRYPVDCWRFYPDAGYALQIWAQRRGIAVQLIESFVADPVNEGWADFVAIFRKGASLPPTRRGRMADHVASAHNIYDITLGGPQFLERERAETFDIRAAAQKDRDLAAARGEIETLRAQVAALERCIAELSEALKRSGRGQTQARIP